MTFLLIIICLVLLWPWISKWLQRMAARRAEDMLRRAMGMPSRKEQERRQRAARDNGSKPRGAKKRRKTKRAERPHPAALMRQVAEDVEYTEYRDYSSDTVINATVETPRGSRHIRIEEQISDAEYTEIRFSKQKGA